MPAPDGQWNTVPDAKPPQFDDDSSPEYPKTVDIKDEPTKELPVYLPTEEVNLSIPKTEKWEPKKPDGARKNKDTQEEMVALDSGKAEKVAKWFTQLNYRLYDDERAKYTEFEKARQLIATIETLENRLKMLNKALINIPEYEREHKEKVDEKQYKLEKTYIAGGVLPTTEGKDPTTIQGDLSTNYELLNSTLDNAWKQGKALSKLAVQIHKDVSKFLPKKQNWKADIATRVRDDAAKMYDISNEGLADIKRYIVTRDKKKKAA